MKLLLPDCAAELLKETAGVPEAQAEAAAEGDPRALLEAEAQAEEEATRVASALSETAAV